MIYKSLSRYKLIKMDQVFQLKEDTLPKSIEIKRDKKSRQLWFSERILMWKWTFRVDLSEISRTQYNKYSNK